VSFIDLDLGSVDLIVGYSVVALVFIHVLVGLRRRVRDRRGSRA